MKKVAIFVLALGLAPATALAEGGTDFCRGGDQECTEYVRRGDCD